MKHRDQNASKDPATWGGVVIFGMGGLVLGGVTLITGSVQDGILAVSAVAAAVQLTRGTPPTPRQ
jgi:hypothetical protein